VDIEFIHPRIELLSRKFLSDNEKPDLADPRHLEKLHVMWGAKEVLYKIHSVGGIEFRKDLFVNDFEYSTSGSLQASILKQGFEREYTIGYEKLGRFMLTWAVE